ncbi:MAG: transporter associated domain-containing protein, partial [Acidimicrobiales bacterium]
LEEIVGEIDDEHDRPTRRLTRVQRPGEWLLAGTLHHDEVFDACGLGVPDGDYETLAGFVLAHLGHIPEVGEAFDHEGWRVEVAELDGRRVATIKLRRAPAEPGEATP